MGFEPPKDWTKESEDLYIHKSGVRIQKTTYKAESGWVLIPVDLDTPATVFPPTSEGREKAFEQFAKGLPKSKPSAKASAEAAPTKSRRGRKPRKLVGVDEEGESVGEEPGMEKPEGGEAEEKEDEEEEEEEEEEEGEA